jgi:hypothetical protein
MLQLFHKERKLFQKRIQRSGPLALRVPLAGVQAEGGLPLQFELRLNATFSPARSGTGSDARELGIVVSSLRLD